MVRSNRRRSRPPAGRPPTGASWFRSTTTATSFRRRHTTCPQSTSTASELCRTLGIDEAARRPDSQRLRADTSETRLEGGRRPIPEPLSGPGLPRETGATRSRASHRSGVAGGSAIGRAIHYPYPYRRKDLVDEMRSCLCQSSSLDDFKYLILCETKSDSKFRNECCLGIFNFPICCQQLP